FQAEGSIRVFRVTGVQPCALPILQQISAVPGGAVEPGAALPDARLLYRVSVCRAGGTQEERRGKLSTAGSCDRDANGWMRHAARYDIAGCLLESTFHFLA